MKSEQETTQPEPGLSPVLSPEQININENIIDQIPQMENIAKLDGSDVFFRVGDKRFKASSVEYYPFDNKSILIGLWDTTVDEKPIGYAELIVLEKDQGELEITNFGFEKFELPKKFDSLRNLLNKKDLIVFAFYVEPQYRSRRIKNLSSTFWALCLATYEKSGIRNIKVSSDITTKKIGKHFLQDPKTGNLSNTKYTSFYTKYGTNNKTEIDLDYVVQTNTSTNLSSMQMALVREAFEKEENHQKDTADKDSSQNL